MLNVVHPSSCYTWCIIIVSYVVALSSCYTWCIIIVLYMVHYHRVIHGGINIVLYMVALTSCYTWWHYHRVIRGGIIIVLYMVHYHRVIHGALPSCYTWCIIIVLYMVTFFLVGESRLCTQWTISEETAVLFIVYLFNVKLQGTSRRLHEDRRQALASS